MRGSKVFISYGREDARAARRIHAALRQAGFEPWLDSEDLVGGQRWQIAIRRAIREADYFVAVLSSHTVSRRGFVQRELKEALDVLKEFPESKTFLIPVRLDECTSDHDALKDLHWVDFFPSFDEGLRRVLAAIDPAGAHAHFTSAALVEVFDVKWVGGGAQARIDDGAVDDGPVWDPRYDYRLATMLHNPSCHEICTFLGNACAIAFQMEPVDWVDWVTVDAITASVTAYQRPPGFKRSRVLPFEQANVFYVEIDDPAVARRNQFTARYVSQASTQGQVGVIRLRPGHPEAFVVRLNALTPGVYTFDVSLDVRHKDSMQNVAIVQSEVFLFAV
jgi:hypothetical protein